MHITIASQMRPYEVSKICIDRESGTCTVVAVGNAEQLGQLVAIAQAVGAPEVVCTVKSDKEAETLCSNGWEVTPWVTMRKTFVK